jgi:L-threonylcarbamoyladenylate synthase
VSGSLDAHYAPATRTQLVAAGELAKAIADQAGRRVALLSFADAPPAVRAHIRAGSDPHAYAHGLYAALRELDAAGCDLILVETPPVGGEWDGINDRLRRAAFGSGG